MYLREERLVRGKKRVRIIIILTENVFVWRK